MANTLNWECIGEPSNSGTVHVLPINDALSHEMESCACIPFTEAVPRDDGSFGWLITHSAWDGRE